jgi:hypothetical protein
MSSEESPRRRWPHLPSLILFFGIPALVWISFGNLAIATILMIITLHDRLGMLSVLALSGPLLVLAGICYYGAWQSWMKGGRKLDITRQDLYEPPYPLEKLASNQRLGILIALVLIVTFHVLAIMLLLDVLFGIKWP